MCDHKTRSKRSEFWCLVFDVLIFGVWCVGGVWCLVCRGVWCLVCWRCLVCRRCLVSGVWRCFTPYETPIFGGVVPCQIWLCFALRGRRWFPSLSGSENCRWRGPTSWSEGPRHSRALTGVGRPTVTKKRCHFLPKIIQTCKKNYQKNFRWGQFLLIILESHCWIDRTIFKVLVWMLVRNPLLVQPISAQVLSG